MSADRCQQTMRACKVELDLKRNELEADNDSPDAEQKHDEGKVPEGHTIPACRKPELVREHNERCYDMRNLQNVRDIHSLMATQPTSAIARAVKLAPTIRSA